MDFFKIGSLVSSSPSLTVHFKLYLISVLFLLCFLGVSNRAVSAEPETYLRDIVITGLDEEEWTRARRVIQVESGDIITKYQVQRIQALINDLELSMNLYSIGMNPISYRLGKNGQSGRISARLVDLVLEFRPPPIIEEIQFFPLLAIDPQFLEFSNPVRPGDVYNKPNIEALTEAMRTEAKMFGYDEIFIRPHHFKLSEESISLGFIIEGPEPATLRRFRYRDAGWGNPAKIRGYLKQSETYELDKGSSVSAAQLLEVEQVSQEIMLALGYLDAVVRLDETIVTDKGVTVYYAVEKNERYRFGERTVEAQVLQSPLHWRRSVERYRNKYFTSSRLKEFEESIERKAQVNGYLDPSIDLNFRPDEEKKRVHVVANVDEGTTSSLGNILVEKDEPKRGYGSTLYHKYIAPPLKDEVIRSRVRAREGDSLNLRVLEDTERRLWSLGTFDEVNVDTRPTSQTMVRDLVMKVREARTAGVSGSIGWNDQYGAIARLSFLERNVGGRGDQISLSTWVSIEDTGFGGEVSYLDRNWKLGEKLIGKEREPSLLYNFRYTDFGFREYSESRLGGSLQLSYLTKEPYTNWSRSWRARLEQISYDPFRDESAYAEDFNSYTAATLAHYVTYDTRNRGDMDSTEGVLFDTGVESGAADGFLLKWLANAELRRSLSSRFGWITRANLGLMPFEATEVGITDRFQIGGLGSIRGFDYRGVGPVDDLNDNLHIGGATMATLQNELRLSVSDNIEIPFFVDMGTLSENPFDLGDPRVSAGLGLRMKLPDTNQTAYIYFSRALIKEDTDDERSVHFGVRLGL